MYQRTKKEKKRIKRLTLTLSLLLGCYYLTYSTKSYNPLRKSNNEISRIFRLRRLLSRNKNFKKILPVKSEMFVEFRMACAMLGRWFLLLILLQVRVELDFEVRVTCWIREVASANHMNHHLYHLASLTRWKEDQFNLTSLSMTRPRFFFF